MAIAPELEGWVANRLVAAHVRNIPAITLGSLLNLVVAAGALWGDLPPESLALAAGGLLVLILHRLWLARGISRRHRTANAGRMIRSFAANGLALGLLVGFGCIVFLPRVGGADRMLLVLAVSTQIAASGYTLRTLPQAARLFIVPAACGLCLGLARVGGIEAAGTVILAAAFTGLMLHMVTSAYYAFVARILRERELRGAGRTVKLLLNAYEENGSDWLFELDARGRMVSVSERFAAAAGRKLPAMEGASFAALFIPGEQREQMIQRIAARQSFRNLELSLQASGEGEARWWSVSGSAIYASRIDGIAFRGVISDVTGQRQAERRARRMAHYDSLTGLPNRALFDIALRRMLAAASDSRTALLLIDLDRFKAVNDVHGHPVGDALIRQVGDVLRAAIDRTGLGGEGHLVARLGGDEFAVIVCGEDACDHAVRLSQELLADLTRPFAIGEHLIETSASIGVALAPDHADTPSQLQVDADLALYAAKRAGRNRWEMFAAGMDREVHERHLLSRDLRRAIADDELRLVLQPLIDLASEETTGYEALLRWQHPTRGLISPADFIRIAEETGQIVPIGEWVIRRALEEAADWSGGETIAINLSPVQLGSPELLAVIGDALAQSGIAPGRVEFEITESVLMENSADNLRVLGRLRELGLKIALDDFGTGFASLNYLLTFPFDKIKIDRSFISQLDTSADSQAIVAAVTGLANRLGMITLAEGVETEAQLEALRELGCQMVQGWLLGEPIPAHQYAPRLSRANVVALRRDPSRGLVRRRSA